MTYKMAAELVAGVCVAQFCLQYFGLSIRFRCWDPLTEKLVRGPFVVEMFAYLCGFDRFWSVWYNDLLQKYVAVYAAEVMTCRE